MVARLNGDHIGRNDDGQYETHLRAISELN